MRCGSKPVVASSPRIRNTPPRLGVWASAAWPRSGTAAPAATAPSLRSSRRLKVVGATDASIVSPLILVLDCGPDSMSSAAFDQAAGGRVRYDPRHMANRWVALAIVFVTRTSMGFQFQAVAAVAPLMVADLGYSLLAFCLVGLAIGAPPGALMA